MNIWVIADTHFGHSSIIEYCKRPFVTANEMDEAMIANWNSVVRGGDVVYHLGDFAYGNHEKVKSYRARLKGKIHLILGNHDYKNRIHNIPHIFTEIDQMRTLKVNHQKIVLCHYAMRVWDASHYNSWQLYGHSHGRLPGVGKQLDVCVDSWKFSPLHIDEVFKIMSARPDNFNFIPVERRVRDEESKVNI
jgi:calcineurin-like phosphoesterase family protein